MARAMKDSGIEWIGEIPEGWEISRNKNCFSCGKEIVGHTSVDTQLLSLTTKGVKKKSETDVAGKVPESYDTYQVVETNDLIMCLFDLDCSAVFSGLSPYNGMVSPAYKILKCNSSILPEYAQFWFSFIFDGRKFKSYAKNLRYTLNYDEFAVLPILLPDVAEQIKIVDFLIRECARIDAVIEQTRASIEEYKKLKQSVITQAVTKGIRPGRKMKDSGIEWVGAIPEEWEVRRIKTLFRLREEKNYLPLEEVNLISLYTDKGVVQHCDLEQTTGNKASNADGYKKVYENDIVVNIILCWMGAVGRSAYTGVTSPAYDIYVPSDEIECRYYHHYFRTKGFSGDCYKRGKGIMAMRWRTYSDQFRDIPVVMPPKKEQQEILAYLDAKTVEIEKLIAKKEKFLVELESYKKSLIFEYVTGKKSLI